MQAQYEYIVIRPTSENVKLTRHRTYIAAHREYERCGGNSYYGYEIRQIKNNRKIWPLESLPEQNARFSRSN